MRGFGDGSSQGKSDHPIDMQACVGLKEEVCGGRIYGAGHWWVIHRSIAHPVCLLARRSPTN
jgi:hypothetical protein